MMNGLTFSDKVNSRFAGVKKSLDKTLKPLTHKRDKKIQGYIYPLVNIHDAKQVIENYSVLNALIRVLASDIILNEFNFYIREDAGLNFEKVDAFWINNKPELEKACREALGYGFGACEILNDNETGQIPVKLLQIPSETLLIKKQTFNGRVYHYAEYTQDGERKLFRITREDYDNISPADDGSVGYVIWFGGGTQSNWYDMPCWTSAYLDIITAITKKELDYKIIRNGNIPKGVLFVKAPPGNSQDGEMSIYESLKHQFKKAGGGVATFYLETPVNDQTLTTEYVNVQEDNYDYLNEIISNTDDILFLLYRVPKERLMINSSSESMNSNKTKTLYEIYTLDLETYQYPFEMEIDNFNSCFFNVDTTCDIKTPIFADTKETKVNTIIQLFSVGIITLKQAISMATALYPEVDWTDIDINDPELAQRFYHGMLFSTPGVSTGMDGLLHENMRGGYQNAQNFNPDATPEELHLTPPRSLFGR